MDQLPMTTDYCLYDHGLPIIASCHLLRIKNIFTCGLLLLYLWE